MDLVVEETLKEFKKVNNAELTPKSIKKIHERFPVPREQKILWAENVKNNKIYGIEIQKDVADMAKRSVKLNDLQDKIQIINKNIKNILKVYTEDEK